MSRWSLRDPRPLLLAEPTRYAAQKLVESFCVCRGWHRKHLHLRTGEDDFDQFTHGVTCISVVTYGMLWKWLTEKDGGYEKLAGRYKGFLLDEFAKAAPEPGDTDIMPPPLHG